MKKLLLILPLLFVLSACDGLTNKLDITPETVPSMRTAFEADPAPIIIEQQLPTGVTYASETYHVLPHNKYIDSTTGHYMIAHPVGACFHRWDLTAETGVDAAFWQAQDYTIVAYAELMTCDYATYTNRCKSSADPVRLPDGWHVPVTCSIVTR